MTVIFTRGQDRINDTADLRALLLTDSPSSFGQTEDSVADVLALSTIVTGQTRPTLTGYTATPDDGLDILKVSWDPPVFGSPPGTQAVGWVLVYEHVTNDADSVPVFAQTAPFPSPVTDGLPFAITFDGPWFTIPGGTF